MPKLRHTGRLGDAPFSFNTGAMKNGEPVTDHVRPGEEAKEFDVDLENNPQLQGAIAVGLVVVEGARGRPKKSAET
jgi:hypothetical protein